MTIDRARAVVETSGIGDHETWPLTKSSSEEVTNCSFTYCDGLATAVYSMPMHTHPKQRTSALFDVVDP